MLQVIPRHSDSDGEAFLTRVRGLDVGWSGQELADVLGPRVSEGETSLTHVRGLDVRGVAHELGRILGHRRSDGEASFEHVRGLDVPHTSAAALVSEGNENGKGSHVNDAKTPSEQEGVALLAVNKLRFGLPFGAEK